MNIFRAFENTIGGILVVGMFTVATATVLSLNPSQSNAEDGSVAGIETNTIQQTDSIIGIVELFPEDVVSQSFDNTYTITFESLSERRSIPALKLNNFSDNEGHVRVEIEYKQSLEQTIKVELVDEYDRLILTSPILGNQQRTITIPEQSSRSFDLVVSSSEPINFPFEVVVTVL
jgi:hypothetical protein